MVLVTTVFRPAPCRFRSAPFVLYAWRSSSQPRPSRAGWSPAGRRSALQPQLRTALQKCAIRPSWTELQLAPDREHDVVVLARHHLHPVLDDALRPPLHAAANAVERRATAAAHHVAQAFRVAALVDVIVTRQHEVDLVLEQD